MSDDTPTGINPDDDFWDVEPGSADSDPYQVMPGMGDGVESSLKAGIRENGVENPVHIDEDGNVIDGHHRVAICNDLGIDDYPTKIHAGLTEQEKIDKAYALNLQERQLDHGQKQELVEQYLTEHWGGEKTQAEIAAMLGVGRSTVSEAKREVISDLDVVETTVDNDSGNSTGLDENKSGAGENEEPDITTTPFSTFSPTGDDKDRERAKQITDAQESGSEEAHQQADRIDKNETTLDTGSRRVEQDQTEDQTEPPEPPDGEYRVILADPPWNYDFSRSSNRDIENQYATMSLADIKKLEPPAADDCVLYLWATAPKLPEALEVLEAWGFEYKTGAVWDKQKIGMGYWFRGQHEHLLIGTRGDVSPPESGDRRASVIAEERGEHSEKPGAGYELVETAFPDTGRVEMFARSERSGWDSWGAES